MDNLARALAHWGKVARSLPRSGDAYPLIDPLHGDRVLAVLVAGRGLVTNFALKDFGITKPIPHVRERDLLYRLLDFGMSDAAAFTSMAALRAAKEEICPFYETQSFPGGTGAGDWNTWVQNLGNTEVSVDSTLPPRTRLNGGTTGATCYSAIPGGGAPDNTNGASLMSWIVKPAGSNTKYLVGFEYECWDTAFNALASFTCIADLLVQAKLSIEVSTLQTVNTTALTRYTNGKGVVAALFNDIAGATSMTPNPSTLTISYTNTVGTSGRIISHNTDDGTGAGTYWYDKNNLNSPAPFMALQAGDLGIKSIETYQASAVATPAASGDILGLHMFKPIVWVPGLPDYQTKLEIDWTMLPQLFFPLATTAGGELGCITMYSQVTSSNLAGVRGRFTCKEG